MTGGERSDQCRAGISPEDVNSSASKEYEVFERNQTNFPSPFRQNYIVPLSSKAKTHVVISNGVRFSPEELEDSLAVGCGLGINLPPLRIAALLCYVTSSFTQMSSKPIAPLPQNNGDSKSSENAEIPPVGSVTSTNMLKVDRKNALRKEINRMANKVVFKHNVEFDVVHRRWIEQNGGSSNCDATEEELSRKLQWSITSFNKNSFANASRMSGD